MQVLPHERTKNNTTANTIKHSNRVVKRRDSSMRKSDRKTKSGEGYPTDPNASFHFRKSGYSDDLNRQSSTLLATVADEVSAMIMIEAAACGYAQDMYEASFRNSSVGDKSFDYPLFAKNEIILGKCLGTGGFGQVLEVTGFAASATSAARNTTSSSSRSSPPTTTEDEEETSHSCHYRNNPNLMETRKFIAQHCYRSTGETRYVVKSLKPKILRDHNHQALMQGLADLNVETRILSSLPFHPNIIKLRAISAAASRFEPDYFIVLDRLVDTLGDRIQQWKAEHKQHNKQTLLSSLKRIVSSRSSNGMDKQERQDLQDELHLDRLFTVFDLSSALAHLHSHNIIHRDLKPDNIGFDIRGDVKIFDFGLAKELPRERRQHGGGEVSSKDDSNGEVFQLTGMCGTPRYMAPEVAMRQDYNESCDVYSFGLLFWQILSFQVPFDKFTVDDFFSRVWNPEGDETKKSKKGAATTAPFRPKISKQWDPSLCTLLEQCWDHDYQKRPTMEAIHNALLPIVAPSIAKDEESTCGGSATTSGCDGSRRRLTHNARRSTYVFPADGNGGDHPENGKSELSKHQSQMIMDIREALNDSFHSFLSHDDHDHVAAETKTPFSERKNMSSSQKCPDTWV